MSLSVSENKDTRDRYRPRIRREPVSAGSTLRTILKKMGLTPSLSRHSLVHRWQDIVEPAVARHARVERVSGSTLHVVVDSSVWMNELAGISTVLLEKINASLDKDAPKIKEIRFTQRSWAKQAGRSIEASEQKVPDPTEEDAQFVQTVLEPIEDPELKSVLQRLLEKDRQLKYRRGSGPQ
jgi:predicted nucleic acid-binding Zn ribbon protein